MIDVIKQTPSVYSEESRDYQIIARLYTALFNYNKMYIDSLRVWSGNIDNKLADLRAMTLGFYPKQKWDKDSLESITTCFKYLEMNKGTWEALEYCLIILIRINKLSGSPIVEPPDERGNINIKIPIELSDLGIVKDLFDYLIPAGLTYRIYTFVATDTTNIDTFNTDSIITFTQYPAENFAIYDESELDSEGRIVSSDHQGYLWYRANIIDSDDIETI